MSNATKDVKDDVTTPGLLSFPVAAAKKIYAGTFGMTDSSGNATDTVSASVKIWGRVEAQKDNTNGSTGDLSIDVRVGVPMYVTNDATNPASNSTPRGAYVYATDNQTAGTSDVGGTLPVAGYLLDVPASGQPNYGKILIMVGQARPDALNPELAAGSTAFTVRAVATSLGAFTQTTGTITANANGAIGTQDGVTLASGDLLLLPLGTVGSATVAAADEGPWIVTSVGGASAKYTLQRPDWWPNAGGIVVGSAIEVGGEGTLFGGTTWKSWVAKGKVIGTDSPALYPARVTQQVTLASSTATITNVPIRSASKCGVFCSLAAAGGTQTSTVAYGPIVAPTPGALGTASLVVDAIASGQTKNGTADTSVINVTILNG